MKRRLSFYVTIEGITIRLKNVSLRTISHAAEQLADLENADELKIMVTPVTQHYDYVTDDSKVFIDLVKKAADYRITHKKDLLPIDQVIYAIRSEFPKSYIKRDSNASITVQDQSNARKKFRVFAGIFNDIVLRIELDNSQPVSIKFDKIEDLIRHLHAMEYFGL